MIYLVNTMNGINGTDCIGTVVSAHRSMDAAERANAALQRSVKRTSPGAYVPTKIVESAKRLAKGDSVMLSEVS